MDREELLNHARTAARRSYSPYSRFRVGAAVLVDGPDGPRVVTGANVENASYGLTLCAERAALAAALTARNAPADGADARGADEHDDGDGDERDEGGPLPRPQITHVAVACIDVPPHAGADQRTPCGACRQWLAELAPDALYYIDGLPGAYHLDDLLPLAFRTDT
jgi:cytidine deaminase